MLKVFGSTLLINLAEVQLIEVGVLNTAIYFRHAAKPAIYPTGSAEVQDLIKWMSSLPEV